MGSLGEWGIIESYPSDSVIDRQNERYVFEYYILIQEIFEYNFFDERKNHEKK